MHLSQQETASKEVLFCLYDVRVFLFAEENLMAVQKKFTALGARVIRIDSGDDPLHKSRYPELHVSGGEYNVAANLHEAFGIPGGLFSARVTGHPWGDLVQESTPWGMALYQKEFRHDGVRGPNIASVFSDRGYGVRGPKVFYNRSNEAAALLKPGDFDFDKIFAEDGIAWAHTGGIFCALSESSAALALEYLRKGRQHNAITSLDLNFRKLLWEDKGGTKKAQAVLRPIVEHVDVLVGNEEDLQLALGLKGPEVEKADDLDPSVFRGLVAQVTEQFPHVKAVATTLRHVRSRNRHDWGMALWLKKGEWSKDEQEHFEAPKMELDVHDRIGGGDGAAAGLFYALMTREVPDWAREQGSSKPWSLGEYAVRMGAAHGALLTTTKGDTTGVKLPEVIHVAKGGSARVAR